MCVCVRVCSCYDNGYEVYITYMYKLMACVQQPFIYTYDINVKRINMVYISACFDAYVCVICCIRFRVMWCVMLCVMMYVLQCAVCVMCM